MRIFSWTLPWLVVLSATTAWGQYGLYGSPELLRLPPMSGPPADNNTYAPSAAQPAAPAVATWQTVPSMSPAAARPLVQTSAMAPVTMPPRPEVLPQAIPNVGIAPANGVTIPPLTPRPAPVDQMLQQAYPNAGPCGCPAGVGAPAACGSVSGPANEFAAAAACGDCCLPNCGAWYGEASMLCMARNTANRVYTTFETGNNPNQLMHTGIPMDWRLGGEVRLGHWFCCHQFAVEGAFWGLGEFSGSDAAATANGVSTPLAVDGIEFAGTNGQAYFDGAAVHRLWRESEVYSGEVNFVHGLIAPSCGTPFQLNCLAGFRYFRLTDAIRFGSLQQGGTWGGNGGRNEAYLDDQITNDLYGLQMGLDGSYAIASQWRLFCNAKFGVFDNHIENTFSAYRGDGTIANPTAASRQVGSYPVHGSADAVSFMTELKMGLNWNFCRNWGAQIGYRVVAVTDVGFSDAQIPFYVVDVPELMCVKHNGDLLLHGAFAGLTWNF